MDHINRIRDDDNITNLRWTTRKGQQENISKKEKKRRRLMGKTYGKIWGKIQGKKNAGEDNGRAKLNSEDVKQIKEIYNTGGGITQKEVGAMFGVSETTVNHILNGKRWRDR